jgi:hypothetical protein
MLALDAINSAFNDFLRVLELQHLTYQPSPHSQHKWLLLYRVPFASAEHRSLEWNQPRSGRGRSRSLHCQARDGLSVQPAQGEKHREFRVAKRVRGWPFFCLLFFGHPKKSKAPKGRNKQPQRRTQLKEKAKLDPRLRGDDKKNWMRQQAPSCE